MSLSRIINKTPLENEKSNIYEINEINSDTLNKVIQSRFIGEGVYILEQFSLPEYNERYFISPSFDKPFPFTTVKSWEFKHSDVMVYQLELNKPFFMPLDIKQYCNLFDSISKLEHVSVFTQVLICKRQDNWRELAINQYDEFLKGNEQYIDSKLIRNMQNKVLNVLNKISNFNLQRDPIDEIDQKILQDAYRFECRFILFEEKYVDYFQRELEKTLNQIRLFNELALVNVRNKKQVIKSIMERSFQMELVNQLLSENEIYSLLTNKVNKQPIAENKPKLSLVRTIKNNHFLESAISFLPTKQREDEQVNQETLEQLQFAFKRVNITDKKLKVLDVFQGSTLIKVQMEIPEGVNYSTIQKNLTNIQAATGNESISIEIGDKPDTINLYLPRDNRDVIYLRDILESYNYQKFVENAELPFILGENTNGELIFGCLADLKHLLIAGATGSGKSVFLNILLISLLLSVPPELLNIVIIDPKEVEFINYEGIPQVSKIVTKPKQAVNLVSSLVDEMEKRYELFAHAKVRNITQYNNKQVEKVPYIVCIIDEYADLVMTDNGVEDHIVRLSQKARAAGIHLVLATQKPLTTIVTSVLKGNLPSTISFRLKTNSDYQTVFGKGIPYTLLGRGDGVAKLEGQHKEYERFQAPVITLDENEEEWIYEKLRDIFKNIQPRKEDEIEKIEPIDELKMIIAKTGETRISELQRLMGIRINVVSDLVKMLVEEGWLEKKGRGYEVVVDKEELEKWSIGN